MKKFERITLVTCIETYRATCDTAMTALDELIDVINKHSVEVTLIDYEAEEYELVLKPKAEEVSA
jgi:hypothetical protein